MSDWMTVTVPTDLDAEILHGFHYATRGLRDAYADLERLARNGVESLAEGRVAYQIGANALAKVTEAQARFEAKREMLRLAPGLTTEHVQAAMTAGGLSVKTAEEG